jgi:hypothetical protein
VQPRDQKILLYEERISRLEALNAVLQTRLRESKDCVRETGEMARIAAEGKQEAEKQITELRAELKKKLEFIELLREGLKVV